MTTDATDRRATQAALVVFGCMLCQMGAGFFYASRALSAEVVADLGWTRTVWSSGMAPMLLVSSVSQAFVGAACARFGVRPVVVASLLCLAISAALFARERDPNRVGQHIELNMLDNALFFFWPDGGMAHTLLDDDVGPGATLYQIMSVINCSDGQLTYYVANESNFKGLFRTIGREDWAEDPRYYTSEGRASDPNIAAEIGAGVEAGFLAWWDHL